VKEINKLGTQANKNVLKFHKTGINFFLEHILLYLLVNNLIT